MVVQQLLCGLFWILFCALHSILASGALKRKLQQRWPAAATWYRLGYTLFAFVSFLAVVLYQLNMDSPLLYHPGLLSQVVGGIILLSGLVVMVLCIKKYFLSLSGLRSLFRKIPAGSLMVTGVHRYVRHPLYSGTFLAIWGFFILMPYMSLLISNIIITGYTLLAIQYEEAKLLAEFGADYEKYRTRVPRIIPAFPLKQG